MATGKVVLDVSMSLDGFTAGPNVREAEPMGDGSERLHAWMAGKGPDGEIDIGVRREVDATVGAAVIGRRTFDLGLDSWAARHGLVFRASWSPIGRGRTSSATTAVLDAVANCSRCINVPAAAAAAY